jgi:hypothetical protein
MIFYLGDKVKSGVPASILNNNNKIGFWKYGYNDTYDIVIISKDGTLGDVYNIMGVRIGLPLKPDDKDIINYGKSLLDQKWKRREMPDGLTADTMHLAKYQDFIDKEYKLRNEGLWIFINNKPIYLTGTYQYGIQWVRELDVHPFFRVVQNELMIFWEACKADNRCFGMDYVKNRRMGASLMAIIELLEAGTITEDKLLGLISKKGKDAKKIFRRLVKGFRRLPCFFQPIWDGTNNPKTELVLEEPTKRKKAGEAITEGDGLGSVIEWHNTEINAMDGDAIFRSLIDEAGKYPKEVPFSEYWYIVKTSHRKGVIITGKSMVVSTVNSAKKGGSEFKEIWDESDVGKRDMNGQTVSGLYRIFIPAKYCLEGMFDTYGFSIVEDPKGKIKTDEGVYVKIGSETWLKNAADALQGDDAKLNEFRRQNPDTIEDAFRDESGDCEFNLAKLMEQIDHNKFELNDIFNKDREFVGNDDMTRGNFRWEGGIQDTTVIWEPDKEKGRFFIKNGCHPLTSFSNKWEDKFMNMKLAKSPMAADLGTIGIDPYNRSKNADGRGSKGAMALTTKTHIYDELPNETMIMEYIDRPKKVSLFYEDVIMAMVYFSVPILSEQSNDEFLRTLVERGYRHYSMNNPYKNFDQLTPTEKELGGAPAQDTKIGDQQFYATEAAVEDYFGLARDDRNRPKGTIGDMPFTRTLTQLKEVDTEKRTKYDAYISYSLSRIGNKKPTKKKAEAPKASANPFTKYNNSGLISKTTA